jgi:pimeloyl-ACP methyl ester carboxylesterase
VTHEDRSVDLKSVTLRYSEWPGASPPIVFLHGVSSWRHTWSPVAAVRGDRRALAFDARGHGESSRADGTYTFAQHAEDAAAFLEHVVGEPAILIGHSQGAMVTIRLAASHPARVLAAVLVDPPLYVAEHGLRDDEAGFEQVAQIASRPVEQLVRFGMPRFRAEMLAQLDPAAMRQIVDGSAFVGWDTDHQLNSLRCPTLLLSGERALNSAIYEGELERARIAQRELRTASAQGAGHLIHVDQPEWFVSTVGAFLDEVAPAASRPVGEPGPTSDRGPEQAGPPSL